MDCIHATAKWAAAEVLAAAGLVASQADCPVAPSLAAGALSGTSGGSGLGLDIEEVQCFSLRSALCNFRVM